MVVVFIVQRAEESSLEETLARPITGTQPEVEDWTPSPKDRCDHPNCPAQAYVLLTGLAGSLMFCSHHYFTIVASKTGENKIKSFAYSIQDKTDMLIENRLIGEN